MIRQNALTVGWSMALIFACGTAATLVFAASAIGEDWKRMRALREDRALIAGAARVVADADALRDLARRPAGGADGAGGTPPLVALSGEPKPLPETVGRAVAQRRLDALTTSLARDAARARSGAVARELGRLAHVVAAKDAVAAALANPQDWRALRDDRLRVLALTAAREGTGAGRRSETLQSMSVREGVLIARARTALEGELAALRRSMAVDAGLVALLLALSGALALRTIRGVDRSLRGLIRTVCRLCIDVETTRIARCPQPDLDRIAEALRILRETQVKQRHAIESTHRMPRDLHVRLDAMVDAAARGDTEARLDVLGFDGNAAVLARGVNDLLDQIEQSARARSA